MEVQGRAEARVLPFFTRHEEGFMQSRSSPEQKAGARVPRETFFRKNYWGLMCSLFCGVSLNEKGRQCIFCVPYFVMGSS
jgi:hypothetical protein